MVSQRVEQLSLHSLGNKFKIKKGLWSNYEHEQIWGCCEDIRWAMNAAYQVLTLSILQQLKQELEYLKYILHLTHWTYSITEKFICRSCVSNVGSRPQKNQSDIYINWIFISSPKRVINNKQPRITIKKCFISSFVVARSGENNAGYWLPLKTLSTFSRCTAVRNSNCQNMWKLLHLNIPIHLSQPTELKSDWTARAPWLTFVRG